MIKILDGREVADSVLAQVTKDVKELETHGILPKLVVIVVGDDPASEVYVRHKEKACKKVGMMSKKIELADNVSQEELLKIIGDLNSDDTVHGLIVQLPLPSHLNADLVIREIDPRKDVDGFHAYNLGKMVASKNYEDLAACTPKGVIKILEYYDIDVTGMNAVVVGRSNIVGKPMAMMLLNRNATVTVCHRNTSDLAAHTRNADLLVVAVGKPGLVTAEMVKEGAVVIDVGTNRMDDGRLVGDVDFEAVAEKAAAITPVPGGVGPMTVACLLANTVTAAKKQANILT